jgi:hypothetical protein
MTQVVVDLADDIRQDDYFNMKQQVTMGNYRSSVDSSSITGGPGVGVIGDNNPFVS